VRCREETETGRTGMDWRADEMEERGKASGSGRCSPVESVEVSDER